MVSFGLNLGKHSVHRLLSKTVLHSQPQKFENLARIYASSASRVTHPLDMRPANDLPQNSSLKTIRALAYDAGDRDQHAPVLFKPSSDRLLVPQSVPVAWVYQIQAKPEYKDVDFASLVTRDGELTTAAQFALAKNPETPSELLAQLSLIQESAILAMTAQANNKENNDPHAAWKKVVIDLLSPETSLKRLEWATKQKSAVVRASAAVNSNTPIENIKQLLNDPSLLVLQGILLNDNFNDFEIKQSESPRMFSSLDKGLTVVAVQSEFQVLEVDNEIACRKSEVDFCYPANLFNLSQYEQKALLSAQDLYNTHRMIVIREARYPESNDPIVQQAALDLLNLDK